MSIRCNGIVKGRLAPTVLAAVAIAFAIPGSGLAVVSKAPSSPPEAIEFLPFTPAGVDPQLAAKVASVIGEEALRFTPASKPRLKHDRTVNFAVRVDRELVVSNRSRGDSLIASADGNLRVTPTRYNLGIARGYQSFTQSTSSTASVPVGIREIAMPDLSTYQSKDDDKPSRFQSRIALEQRDRAGTTPRTLNGAGSQELDLGGSYRLSRNLDVTAGVRLSRDRDRLEPLTNGGEDDQAVYVGTQIRF